MSGGPITILVHDQAGALWTKLDGLVEGLGAPVVLLRTTDPIELGRVLTERRVDVLVAGPGLDSRSGFARLRIIRDELPRLVLVLAMGRLDHHEANLVIPTGAVDLFQPSAEAAEVRRALDRAIALSRAIADPATVADRPAAPATDGGLGHRVITVASASGGSGKTFLATNLAWFLAAEGGRRTAIIDLDLQFGEVSSSLQLRPRYTITDLIQQGDEPASELEAHIEEFFERHESGVSVLAAPRSPAEADVLRPEDIARVIDAARRHYDDVIIDTSPTLSDAVLAAAKRSDELLVVATLDIPSIRNLQVLLDSLEVLGVPTDVAHLLLNKVERDGGIDLGDVAQLFPNGFDASLPYAREAQQALNAGRPVMAHRPDSPIARELAATLARLLPDDRRAAVEARLLAERPRSRWWGRRQEAVAS